MAMTSRSVSSAAWRSTWRTVAVPSPQVVWMCRSALPTGGLGKHRLKGQPLVGPAADELLENLGHARGFRLRVSGWHKGRPDVGDDPSAGPLDGRAEDHGRLATCPDDECQIDHPGRAPKERHLYAGPIHAAVADDRHDLVAIERSKYIP